MGSQGSCSHERAQVEPPRQQQRAPGAAASRCPELKDQCFCNTVTMQHPPFEHVLLRPCLALWGQGRAGHSRRACTRALRPTRPSVSLRENTQLRRRGGLTNTFKRAQIPAGTVPENCTPHCGGEGGGLPPPHAPCWRRGKLGRGEHNRHEGWPAPAFPSLHSNILPAQRAWRVPASCSGIDGFLH